MFFSLIRFICTLAIVSAAFGAYQFVAVPMIEPSVQRSATPEQPTGELLSAASRSADNDQIAALFSPDDWERQNPKVLRIPQGRLLFRDYHTKEDTLLEIKPCTLILNAKPKEGEDGKEQRRPVVMQAPDGAQLSFDAETNLTRGQVGQITGGMLVGPIVIRSPASSPEADDGFELRTRNVQITPERIITPHEVAFRYGKNEGTGRDLILTMAPNRRRPSNKDLPGASFGDLLSIELVHVDNIRLHTDKGTKWDGLDQSAPSTPQEVAVGITCAGPFKFDIPTLTASFRNHVDVIRLDMPLPCDQLHCDFLAVRFAQRTAAAGPAGSAPAAVASPAASPRAKPSELSSLRVQSILATGSPLVLKAPSYFAHIEAEELEYDFDTRNVRIGDNERLMLRYKQNEVEARSVQYQLAEENGRIGQGRMIGPGSARGFLDDDPQKAFYVAWKDRMIVQQHQGQHAISLVSAAEVRMTGMGQVKADALHVWLRDAVQPPAKPDEKPQVTYEVDRLLAERDVVFDSPQLVGDVQRAEVWLREIAPTTNATAAAPKPSGASTVAPQQPANAAASSPNANPSPRQNLFAARPSAASASPPQQQKFELHGERVQVQLVKTKQETTVEHLILDGEVRFREIRTAKPDDVPLTVTAGLVQLRNANTPAAEIRVQGQPAEVAARGMLMTGEEIRLHRGENRMWIEGAGKMVLPEQPPKPGAAARGSEGLLAGRMDGPLTVTWSQGMDFNGLTARFLRDVQVRGRQISDQGELFDVLIVGHELAVSLDQRVDFSKDDRKTDASVRTLAFIGGVYLQNVGSQRGSQTSFDRMQVRDLQLDQLTGRIHALGPGWGASVRHDDAFNKQTAPLAAAPATDRKSGLAFVRVDYEDELAGNLHQRELTFRGRVHTVYGPVQDWEQTLNPDPVEGLAEGQFLMTSQTLTLTDMSEHTPGSDSAIELAATGNATIESPDFTARGWRISYARAKEMLVLEGDGRNDAELWLDGSTTRDAAAQQVRFWTNDKSIQVDGGRFLNLSQLGNMSRR